MMLPLLLLLVSTVKSCVVIDLSSVNSPLQQTPNTSFIGCPKIFTQCRLSSNSSMLLFLHPHPRHMPKTTENHSLSWWLKGPKTTPPTEKQPSPTRLILLHHPYMLLLRCGTLRTRQENVVLDVAVLLLLHLELKIWICQLITSTIETVPLTFNHHPQPISV